MRTTIEMAREAAGDDWGLFQEYMPEIHRLVELVRTDERARMAGHPAQQEPVAYWIPKAEQFCIADPNGRPFAKAWEPLYTSPPAQQEPVAWRELLREARDNCKASIVEEGISASRKEYRIELETRLTAALNTSPQAQPASKPLPDEEQVYEEDLWDERDE